jgi:hypothetical protein
MMQITKRIEACVTEIQSESPADYSAMKEKLIRQARVCTGDRHSGGICTGDRCGRRLRNAAEPSAMPAVA